MFGVMFLFRLAQLALALVIAGAILYGFVWLINRGVQLVAKSVGIEAVDFFDWIRPMLPRRKKRKPKQKQ